MCCGLRELYLLDDGRAVDAGQCARHLGIGTHVCLVGIGGHLSALGILIKGNLHESAVAVGLLSHEALCRGVDDGELKAVFALDECRGVHLHAAHIAEVEDDTVVVVGGEGFAVHLIGLGSHIVDIAVGGVLAARLTHLVGETGSIGHTVTHL